MSGHKQIITLGQLGNIYSSNGDFTTRAAILQSFYRVSINEECGIGNKRILKGRKKDGKPIFESLKQEYGHLVSGGKTRNINFFFDETFEYAKYRIKTKIPEETINSNRLFNNLLSSMPMAFNLFHPLILIKEKYPDSITKMVKNVFPELPVDKVDNILIEYIPIPVGSYIMDGSAMDAAILFKDILGKEYIISIETKYTDQLGQNKAKDNSLKLDIAKSLGMFTTMGLDLISKGCTQIYRNFLLTEKYRFVHRLADSFSIILAPRDHPTTDKEIDSLVGNLIPDFKYKLRKYALEDFIESLKPHCPEEFKKWLNWFYNRYLDFNKTENLYKEFINQ
ncbi:MAG TPA: hypothetical protein P5180_06850 [Bacteroidales bacterium]|nr:hypothetical protein [Bacteroidales bacterium]